VLWTNGTPSVLTLPSGTTTALITSVAASGSNVYVTGYVIDANSVRDAVLWTNGTPAILPLPSTGGGMPTPTSIAVNGSDVYVSGDFNDTTKGQYVACYWKNGGTPVEVSDGTEVAVANAIAVQ
jgi:hypothetical protein